MSRNALLFLLFFIVGCVNPNSSVIKIGLNSWPGYELLYTAKQLGLYEKYGLNVEVIEFGSLSDAKIALQRGHIDLMASTLTEVITAYTEAGIQAKIIFSTDYSNGPDMILSKSDRLSKGTRIALETGSLGVFMLGMALRKYELQLEDVKVVPSDLSKMTSLMELNKIDAAITYEPYATNMRKKIKGLHNIFDSSEIPNMVIDVVSARKEILEKHPNLRDQLLTVWDEAILKLKENPDEIIKIMASREKIEINEFKEMMNGLVLLSKDEQSKIDFKKALEINIDTLYKLKDIDKKPEPSLFLIE